MSEVPLHTYFCISLTQTFVIVSLISPPNYKHTVLLFTVVAVENGGIITQPICLFIYFLLDYLHDYIYACLPF